MNARLLLREYFVLLLMLLLMFSTILSSLVTSHRSCKIFQAMKAESLEKGSLKKE